MSASYRAWAPLLTRSGSETTSREEILARYAEEGVSEAMLFGDGAPKEEEAFDLNLALMAGAGAVLLAGVR